MCIRDRPRADSFFRNETEYILYGSDSDQENYKKAKRAIRTVRTALNMSYIYSNPEMVRETLALAESLTPGPFVPLTQLLIIAAWSSLESYNDMKNLEEMCIRDRFQSACGVQEYFADRAGSDDSAISGKEDYDERFGYIRIFNTGSRGFSGGTGEKLSLIHI